MTDAEEQGRQPERTREQTEVKHWDMSTRRTYLASLQVTSNCCEEAPPPLSGRTQSMLQSNSLHWLLTESEGLLTHTHTHRGIQNQHCFTEDPHRFTRVSGFSMINYPFSVLPLSGTIGASVCRAWRSPAVLLATGAGEPV